MALQMMVVLVFKQRYWLAILSKILSGGGSRKTLCSRSAHTVKSRRIGINKCNRVCWASFHALWITAAKIAFRYFASCLIVIDRAERTGDGANLAAYTFIQQHLFRAGRKVNGDRIHRTGLHTPGLITLGTGVRSKATLLVEIKYFYAGFRGVKDPFGFIRTGHLTLQTTCAFEWVDMQGLQHGYLLVWNTCRLVATHFIIIADLQAIVR
jgi:hypothetical protein